MEMVLVIARHLLDGIRRKPLQTQQFGHRYLQLYRSATSQWWRGILPVKWYAEMDGQLPE